MDIHRVFARLIRPFRERRMRRFTDRLGVRDTTTVLDVGGSRFNWSLAPVSPKLVLCNLNAPPDLKPQDTFLVADACLLPFRDRSFDVVFSNSVIEHLGGHDKQQDFARECSRVGRSYFVQTPNKWFFLEPHLLTPFVHWLPIRLRPWVIRNLTLRAWLSRPTREWTREFVETTRLLDGGQLRALFPDAQIRKESFLGLTKALIAWRYDRPAETSG